MFISFKNAIFMLNKKYIVISILNVEEKIVSKPTAYYMERHLKIFKYFKLSSTNLCEFEKNRFVKHLNLTNILPLKTFSEQVKTRKNLKIAVPTIVNLFAKFEQIRFLGYLITTKTEKEYFGRRHFPC